MGAPVQPGPALDIARAAANAVPVFVLTARSGWFAVKRLRASLQYWDITLPLEHGFWLPFFIILLGCMFACGTVFALVLDF